MQEPKKITAGTKEWADKNVNCINGCSHNCRYCYAKKMAIRFGRKTEENWKDMEIRQEIVRKKYRKVDGRIMFPSSHDITPEEPFLSACLAVIENLLEAGNSILITSKPHFEVIKKICDQFIHYQKQIQFRFTITSDDNEFLQFWEPGAPLFEERLEALKYAFEKGYKTSISIEPFLSDPIPIIEKVKGFVTESIWVGPMNYIKTNGISNEEKKYYEKIRKLITIENLLEIKAQLDQYKQVRLKDAFLNHII